MRMRLKVYLLAVYLIFILTLFYSWEGIDYNQLVIMFGFIFLAVVYNLNIVNDIQSNMHFIIIFPFLIPVLVYLDPFYGMLFLIVFTIIKFRNSVWYKKLFNASMYSISMFISANIYQYFYPEVIEINDILSPSFFGVLLIAALVNKTISSGLVFTVISLEKGKFDNDAFISNVSTIKTAVLTFFLGLINVVIFYYTNLIGVAIFTFIIYFIKPALQYRQIFDNELSTYTNFVLIILKQMDPVTHSHSERVKFWTVLMATKMKLSPTEVRQLSQAASWHDVGKIEVPFNIINKPGKLADEEYALVKNHPERGYELVKELHFFKKFLPVIRYHHERYDGKGYPTGLKGEEIPLHARIMAITDAFDAMTSDRSYRMGMEMKEAVEELTRYSGTQFDPRLVNIFIEALKEEYGQTFEKYNKEIIMNVG